MVLKRRCSGLRMRLDLVVEEDLVLEEDLVEEEDLVLEEDLVEEEEEVGLGGGRWEDSWKRSGRGV